MIVLGIETSGPVGSLAIRRDGRCIEERFLPELGRRHAQSLVPEAADLLRRHELDPTMVDAVAVSVGPGSFTGLRVGVTFAKSFAFAARCRLTAVDTFLAIAANTPAESAVRVIADAQRRGVMVGDYRRDAQGRFSPGEPIRIVAVEELRHQKDFSPILTGPGLSKLEPGLQKCWTAAPISCRMPRASIVARLGEDQFVQGDTVDPWTLEPRYVRKSGAEEKRDATRLSD